MRRTRKETIEHYRSDFLEDKSEEYKKRFDDKDLNKQYAAIMNWRKKIKKANEEQQGEANHTFPVFFEYLKAANSELSALVSLSPKEADKTRSILNDISNKVENFNKIQMQRKLDILLKEEERLQKERNHLMKKITKMQNDINNN